MGCSPSHALIINSSRAPEPICLQPRIYMVSESTLRILEDVGELRIYQQEDKDPGVARVRFGTSTLDQLENPVGYQSQVTRQYSIDSEKSLAIARQDSKITVNLGTTEEEVEEADGLDQESGAAEDEVKEDLPSCLTRQSSTSSSTTMLISAQIHNPSPDKMQDKENSSIDLHDTLDTTDRQNLLESVSSSRMSLS